MAVPQTEGHFSREAELGLETVATWGFNPPKLDRPTGVAFNGEYAKRNWWSNWMELKGKKEVTFNLG